jgi:uncharacterized damage-inducible protein DinB
MRIATLALLSAVLGVPVWAQPEVNGKVVDQATLRYVEIRQGTGAPAKPGQQFTVHYTGWLKDGKQFDSSVGKEPLKFVQGRREVIAGFDVGFEGMQVGGKRRLFIPYQLAYGETGRGSIPPKAELIFDIELMDAADAPQPTAAADLLFPFGGMEQQVLALANAVPEEKYSWRPGAGVRSFKEVFLHIALGNRLMLNIANGLAGEQLNAQIAENTKTEAKPASKAEVIAALTGSFAEIRKALEAERAPALGRNIVFFGTATTRRGVLTSLDVHIGEHLGQAIAYARVNGIVPPWSK